MCVLYVCTLKTVHSKELRVSLHIFIYITRLHKYPPSKVLTVHLIRFSWNRDRIVMDTSIHVFSFFAACRTWSLREMKGKLKQSVPSCAFRCALKDYFKPAWTSEDTSQRVLITNYGPHWITQHFPSGLFLTGGGTFNSAAHKQQQAECCKCLKELHANHWFG